jgi:SAM-dependent methyltransferase
MNTRADTSTSGHVLYLGAGMQSSDVSQEKSILNLGCGHKKDPAAINVDVTSATNPDIVCNLNLRPWPFPADRFTEVRMYDVIEHLDDLVGVMEELHRVCRHGAVIKITTPHFSSANAFTDPTHRHYFSVASLNYFTGDNEFDFYTDRRFRKRTASINFYPSLINKLVHRIANRWPEKYERRWAWMFPAWFLNFELIVVKGAS